MPTKIWVELKDYSREKVKNCPSDIFCKSNLTITNVCLSVHHLNPLHSLESDVSLNQQPHHYSCNHYHHYPHHHHSYYQPHHHPYQQPYHNPNLQLQDFHILQLVGFSAYVIESFLQSLHEVMNSKAFYLH